LAAVEGGILPPGMATLNEQLTAKPAREPAGQDARLYGRRDARRYAKQILSPREKGNRPSHGVAFMFSTCRVADARKAISRLVEIHDFKPAAMPKISD